MAQKILIADDQIASRRMFEMVLSREGYDVISVSSGADVLDTVTKKRPDIALIDAIMPGVDGFQVCESLKKHPNFKTLPVVLLAGKYEPFDKARGLKMVGEQAILSKPATSGDILAKVQQILAEQAKQAQAAKEIPAQTKPTQAKVVEEPPVVQEEYEFDEDSEEADLVVESEILEEGEVFDIEDVPQDTEDFTISESMAEEDREVEEEIMEEADETEEVVAEEKAVSEEEVAEAEEPEIEEEIVESEEPEIEEEIVESEEPEIEEESVESEEPEIEEEIVESEEPEIEEEIVESEEPEIDEEIVTPEEPEITEEIAEIEETQAVEIEEEPAPQPIMTPPVALKVEAKPPVVTPQKVVAEAAPKPSKAEAIPEISEEKLDMMADQIAQRLAGKIVPALMQELAVYLLQFPAINSIIENTSKRLVKELLPEIQDKV